MSSLKRIAAAALMPIAQSLVRRLPAGRIREQVWRWGHWRQVDFITEVNGVMLAGSTLDLIQGYLYWFGVWEPNLTQFITKRMSCRPNGTFIDVGANIGYFSTLVAKKFPSSCVVSIEAFPPTFEKLQLNISRNALENIRTIASAAGDQSGSLRLFYAGDNNEGATTSIPGKFRSDAVTVPSEPLAKLLSSKEIANIRLIKIDVEGAESLVIKGLKPRLYQLPEDAEIVVEVSAGMKEQSEFIFDTLFAHGYSAYELVNKYSPMSYLYPSAIASPRRLLSIPQEHTDVVFSKVKAEYL